MRLFIALELPPSVRLALQQQIDHLRDVVPRELVRWVLVENIHLTLKFLGDVESNQLDAIQAGLQRASQASTIHSLQAVGLGCFPDSRRPHVIWVGVGGQIETLMRLRDQVEAEIAPLGFPTEDRPFSPHLTLGRVKTDDRRHQSELGSLIEQMHVGEIAEWTATEVRLMRSTLKPSGAMYETLAQFDLTV